MKELRQIGKILGLPLYVDVAQVRPLDKDRKVELAEKILRRAFGVIEPKVKRVRRPRKNKDEIPVLPGQTNIMEALDEGARTRHGECSVHGRISTDNGTLEVETASDGTTTGQRCGLCAAATDKLPRADGSATS